MPMTALMIRVTTRTLPWRRSALGIGIFVFIGNLSVAKNDFGRFDISCIEFGAENFAGTAPCHFHHLGFTGHVSLKGSLKGIAGRRALINGELQKVALGQECAGLAGGSS